MTLLPSDAKYFGFIDNKIPFNHEWDFTWSLTFALTGQPYYQCAFCTFLTTDSTKLSGIGGHYLGYLGFDDYLLDEFGVPITTEDGTFISVSENNPNILAIAFDTTGYFGLSGTYWKGVSPDNVKPNSIIVRNSEDLLYYEELSAVSSDFFLTSLAPNYQTIRFRWVNAGSKLYVDLKVDGTYKNMINIPINVDIFDTDKTIYPAFTFCAPISSTLLNDATMLLTNFHTQGHTGAATYE